MQSQKGRSNRMRAASCGSEWSWAFALALIAALSWAVQVRAANCEFSSTTPVVESVPADGVLAFYHYCTGGCDETLGSEYSFVAVGGEEPIDGELEVVRGGLLGDLFVFTPAAPLAADAYEVRGPRDHVDATFAVGAEAPMLDLGSLELRLEYGLRAHGERACCPTFGENDCDALCLGAEGERHVAAVGLVQPPAQAGVAWRITPRSEGDARGTGYRFVGQKVPANDATLLPEAIFVEPADEYCVELELWNLVDGSRVAEERCLTAAADEPVGEVVASWPQLENAHCSGPLLVGGWGYDMDGEPDPRDYPEAREAHRVAFCESRPDCQRSLDEPWCEHYAHYCPELAPADASSGCSTTPGGTHGGGPWAFSLALFYCALRRRDLRAR